jgi:hypothetical protein
MNKFLLFLAVFSLVFFAACSDDKKDPCDDGPTKDCLVGEWKLEEVLYASGAQYSNKIGTLKLESKPSGEFYEFTGGEADHPFVGGLWSVDGKTLAITVDGEETVYADIALSGSNTMKIKSKTKRAVISWFLDNILDTPTERFTRR